MNRKIQPIPFSVLEPQVTFLSPKKQILKFKGTHTMHLKVLHEVKVPASFLEL